MTTPVRPHQRRALVALVIVGLCACTHAARVGPAVPLAIGDPRDACEQEGWLELAPAEVRQWGTSAVYGGLALFRPGQKHPEDLGRVLDRLQAPTLQTKLARMKRTDAASSRSLYWALGGLGGLTVGLGAGAALNDRNHTAANVFGFAGLVTGLVGVIGALVTMPPLEDSFDAEAGHYLFFDAQDDMRAVARGTDRADQAVRQACTAGGRRN